MKIRSGFISNSSSSCFVALIPMSELPNLNLTSLEKTILHFTSQEITFLGQKCLNVETYSGNACNLYNDEEISEEDIIQKLKEIDLDNPILKEVAENYSIEDRIFEAQSSLQEKIMNNSNTFSTSLDM